MNADYINHLFQVICIVKKNPLQINARDFILCAPDRT